MSALIKMLPVLVILAGCASQDLGGSNGEVRSGPNGTYTFKTIADAAYPDGSSTAESERLSTMRAWLARDGICGGKYAVLKREAFTRTNGLLGDVKDIVYTLRCA